MRTTKVQTSLHISSDWSAPLLFTFWENFISDLATSEFSSFQLVSVAEETGLSLTLSDTPKTGFVASGSNSSVCVTHMKLKVLCTCLSHGVHTFQKVLAHQKVTAVLAHQEH